MSNKFDRYKRNIPETFKPGINPVVTALLKSWAEQDDEVVKQLKETKSQIQIRNAEGDFLDRLASGLGVSRPAALGLLDSDFQELIPNLSLKAKQIKKTFYDTMDVFWGPLFSRANIESSNFAPFNLNVGETFQIKVDGQEETQEIKILSGDLATPGSATAEEVSTILSRIEGVTISIIEDQITGNKAINIRTNTPGALGRINIVGGTMLGSSKLDFDTGETRITDLDQRTVIYQIRSKELIIELPAVLPTLRRTLQGSHHFHQDSTLESPVPPENGIWQGSFIYDPNGVSYTVTRQNATLQQSISEGSVVPTLTVSGASDIPDAPGFLIFDWGKDQEEQPVRYLGRPNSNTLLIDPSHTFANSHSSGETINVLQPELQPFEPATSGEDLAVYLTSPSGSRQIVQDILKTLAAAGVVINFEILLPTYKYLCGNPYS